MNVPAKSKLRLGLIAGLGILATLGALAIRAQWGLSQAEKFAAAGQWEAVRQQLGWYLRLHPRDERAHRLMARSYASEREILPAAAHLAIYHLAQVTSDPELAASAQLDAGRLELLVLQRPQRAEMHFRQAVRLDSDLFQAQFLLWKVLELTGRSRHAEPDFWKVYELCPEPLRIVRLREWYLGQFYPQFANAPMDQSFGFLRRDETPSEMVEKRRLDRFLEAEPDAPLAATAIAQWHHRRGNPLAALKMLDKVSANVKTASDDPYFVATRVRVLLDLGDYDLAQVAFDQWPATAQGYAYWLSRAILLDEAEANYEEAILAYDKALQIWPGPIDWRTRARKANCLARLGRQDQAQITRQQSRKTQATLEGPSHERVRQMLERLDRKSNLKEVVDFYRQLGRDREADCWEKQIAVYRGSATPDYAVPVEVPQP